MMALQRGGLQADAFFASGEDESPEIPADVPRHGRDGRPWVRHDGVDYDPSDYHSSTRKSGRGAFYARASSVGKPLEDWFQVNEAQRQRIVYGMGRRPELFARAQALQSWDADRPEIRAITEEAITAGGGLEAAQRGTVFHELNEQRIRGGYDLTHLAEDMAAGLDVLARLLEPFDVLDTEQFVVWDEEGIAGSYDMRLQVRRPTPIYRKNKDGSRTLLATLEPGEVIVADLKSGKDRKYHGPTYAVQQLPYACGVPYSHREGRQAWPGGLAPSTAWAVIPHVSPLDPSTAGLYWVDLEGARRRLEVVKAIKELRRVDDLFLPAELPVEPLPILGAISAATSPAELNAVWQSFQAEWRDMHTGAVRARLAELSSATTEVRTS